MRDSFWGDACPEYGCRICAIDRDVASFLRYAETGCKGKICSTQTKK
jgi:hypothetical protein